MARRALSREEKVKEILKCGRDPKYFIRTYVKIQHPDRGRIPFDMYDFQDDIIDALQGHRFNIVLKSRQLGLSTIAAAYSLWFAIFHKDKNILVIATKLGTAINFVKKVKVALSSVPDWLLLPKYEANKMQVSFDNGSQITAIPTSDDAGRSESVSLLIVDEAAIIRNFEDIWTGLYPTISTGGSAFILSTPKGVGGQYHKLWIEAEAGQNGFNPIKLPWWVHPEHDEAWYIKESKNMPPRKAAQEFLCDFVTSGDTFLQPEDLANVYEAIKDPIEKAGFDRNVWIWAHPIINRNYVITADVSRGDSADYSTFHIIDAEENEVVAEYMGKVTPEKLAKLIIHWGKKYNNALACPENNNFGYLTATILHNEGYPRLYYHHKGKGVPTNLFEYSAHDKTRLAGFSTQRNTRPQILSRLEELIRTEKLKTYSQRLYDQLLTFVWIGDKPSALKGSHDDLVMSLAIGAWLVGGSSGTSSRETSMAYAILNATKRVARSHEELPGGINDVKPLVNPAIMGYNANNVAKPRQASDVRHVDISDFSWLYR